MPGSLRITIPHIAQVCNAISREVKMVFYHARAEMRGVNCLLGSGVRLGAGIGGRARQLGVVAV